MGLPYHPKLATIYLCDFPKRDANLHEGDLELGETDKTRLVIVMNRKLEGRGRLVNIVPISMTPPAVQMPWHVLIPKSCLPPMVVKSSGADRYAKCDMICTVSLDRLSLYQGHWNSKRERMQRKRITESGKLDLEALKKVKLAIAAALGIHPALLAANQVRRELRQAAEDPVNLPEP
jgi:uncharacterized protein YifN (PemK superfamily)